MNFKHYKTAYFVIRYLSGDEQWIIFSHQKTNKVWAWWTNTKIETPKKRSFRNCQVLHILSYFHGISLQIFTAINESGWIYPENWSELSNRNRIVFYRDYVQPYIPLATREKLSEVGWEIHPISIRASISDHLFGSLQNFFNRKTFTNDYHLKSHLYPFFVEL